VDGLCGFYALLNFFRHFEEFEEETQFETDRSVFQVLLEAAESLGLLSASSVHGGFRWWSLKRIFDRVAEDARIKFVAVPIAAVKDHLSANSFSDIANFVIQNRGQIVASVDNGNHWVLVHGSNSRSFLVDDADPTNARDGRIGRAAAHLSLSEGLALIPANSDYAKLS
jgi:hypothetical protein